MVETRPLMVDTDIRTPTHTHTYTQIDCHDLKNILDIP